ncbi:hypothetical protein [Pandoraea sp. NPDC090278]|uniref:hypothetical protein n=1 Tax=Pandoraea sp. NPDC090278 TaxID=3364391 RepID=UPI00383ABCD2
MPIEFERVPARKPVPEPASLSFITAIATLAVTLFVGAALTFALWPTDVSSNTPSLLAYAVGLSVAAWAFSCCIWLGYADVTRSSAVAYNVECDALEQRCHNAASVPLIVLGHTWCFSSDPVENQLAGILDGSVKAVARPSAAQAGVEVKARWIDMPGRTYAAGNMLNEFGRHTRLVDWLYEHLFKHIVDALQALPANARLDVAAHVSASVELEWAIQALEDHIRRLRPDLKVLVTPFPQGIPLF